MIKYEYFSIFNFIPRQAMIIIYQNRCIHGSEQVYNDHDWSKYMMIQDTYITHYILTLEYACLCVCVCVCHQKTPSNTLSTG